MYSCKIPARVPPLFLVILRRKQTTVFENNSKSLILQHCKWSEYYSAQKKRALQEACAQKGIRSKRHALQNKIFLGLKLKIFKHCGSYSLFLWADNILLSNTINFAPINNQKDILMIKSQHWLYYMLVHTQYILLQDINWNTN